MMGATYATQKAMKESVGTAPKFVETSMFGAEFKGDGNYVVVGPDAYRNRKWYAEVTVKDGLIAKVK